MDPFSKLGRVILTEVRDAQKSSKQGRLEGCGLYAITDGPRADLIARAEHALQGGAAVLQYRDKTDDAVRRIGEATALRAVCERHGVNLIINDDVELARVTSAHGVHLGRTDADPCLARAILGERAIIGVSCYNDLSRARKLATLDVDYLAFGSFFDSPTKPAAQRAPLDILESAHALGLPVVAIGGITPCNGAALIAAGADFLAVISGVFAATNIEAAARAYASLFDRSAEHP